MGILMGIEVIGSKKWVINFYQEQLEYFDRVGLGKYTSHDVKVTQSLIESTKKRLNQLTTVYDARLSPQAHKLRKAKRRLKLRERLNGIHTNGSASRTRSKSNSTNGHESGRS